jgi:hypothetical protein
MLFKMKKNALLFMLAAAAFAGSGCSLVQNYAADRFNDLADVVSAGVGLGYGFDARLHVSDLFYPCIGWSETKMVGLRGRNIGTWREAHYGFPCAQAAGIYYYFFTDNKNLWRLVYTYHNWEERDYSNPILIPKSLLYDLAISPFGSYDSTLTDSEYPADTWVIGAGFTLFFSMDFGLNLYELVDFALGFVTIDIVGDDILTRQRICEEAMRKHTPSQEKVIKALQEPPLGSWHGDGVGE